MTKNNAKDLTSARARLDQAKMDIKAMKYRNKINNRINARASKGESTLKFVVWVSDSVWEIVERGLVADGFSVNFSTSNICEINW